jgi:hypothetical protein
MKRESLFEDEDQSIEFDEGGAILAVKALKAAINSADRGEANEVIRQLDKLEAQVTALLVAVRNRAGVSDREKKALMNVLEKHRDFQQELGRMIKYKGG